MGLDATQQMLIEQRVTNDSKNVAVAYILWFFLSVFGAHRFYLGRTGSAIIMLILTITFIGLFVTVIWALVDLFLIPGMVKEDRDKLRQRLTMEALAHGGTPPAPKPASEPRSEEPSGGAAPA